MSGAAIAPSKVEGDAIFRQLGERSGVACGDIDFGSVPPQQIGNENAANSSIGASNKSDRSGDVHDDIPFP